MAMAAASQRRLGLRAADMAAAALQDWRGYQESDAAGLSVLAWLQKERLARLPERSAM